ncbi:MAG: quinone-dependent dihydroorotate dehydrogenase [Pseudolabrys sp.]
MIGFFERLSRPLLRALDPEDAHALALKALKYVPARPVGSDSPLLAVRAFGLQFPNPVGIAAGFDKNAVAVDQLLRARFGFVEIGSVTPRPQAGNPRPRVFRLEADQAVINRLGFNNEGEAAVLARLAARGNASGIVGINIGANRDSADRIADYARLIEAFSPHASYFTVNVSSPNTPGLRDLQQAKVLDELLSRVLEARERAARKVPVLLKIAPDLTLTELDDVVGVARRLRVDGMIVGNTTISRPSTLHDSATAQQAGGLSGRPLFRLATRMLAETFVRAESVFPLIGVGGVDSGATAIAKIKAGATLLQLYTGLIYRGLGLVGDIKHDLETAIRRGHRSSLAAMIGSDAATITAESWPT